LHAAPLQVAWVVKTQLPPPNGVVEGPPLMTMADALVATPNTASRANLANVPTSFIPLPPQCAVEVLNIAVLTRSRASRGCRASHDCRASRGCRARRGYRASRGIRGCRASRGTRGCRARHATDAAPG